MIRVISAIFFSLFLYSESQASDDLENFGPLPSFFIMEEHTISSKFSCSEIRNRVKDFYFDEMSTLDHTITGQIMCFERLAGTWFRIDMFVYARTPAGIEKAETYAYKRDNLDEFGVTLTFRKLTKKVRLATVHFGNTDPQKYPYGLLTPIKSMTLPAQTFQSMIDANDAYNAIRLKFLYGSKADARELLHALTKLSKSEVNQLMSQSNTIRYEFKDIYYDQNGKTTTLHAINLPQTIDLACHKTPTGKCTVSRSDHRF